jgi:hypothetical protein
MTSPNRSVCLVGLAAALVLSTSGCSGYTYFNVHVSVDSNVTDQTLAQVDNCYVRVLDASGNAIESSRELVTTENVPPPGARECNFGKTPRDLGTLDYSTAKSGGTLRFLVYMTTPDTDPSKSVTMLQGLADGSPRGGVTSLDLVAKPCGDNLDTKCIVR